MNTYAAVTDLTTGNWLPDVPANAEALLRSATVLVALAAGRNPYTDPEPAGTEADALRDATCAQVAAWVGSGIDPVTGVAGEQAPLKRTEIFEGKVEYDTKALAEARAAAARDLAAEARAVLQVAGLLAVAVPLFDETGVLPSWGLDTPDAYRWPAVNGWPQW